ncbi:SDR family NAD(P)-dependent oxidoreductase [Polyangium mundeleinium]|uniref:SDR family NAD(P)-dependent oxidoreductase n=1 Tax=Polyangium mundeleinium TaxID=2995306 RepID=A0ABT5EVU5_9BACT|nr:SDR family NAD(P)-dependent oxidoreductase [Polyangium mundeleinium]MDC0745432.1 SDR family NAD(P)-dependent oxidoreductase [Polyangium mundeleinium]
MNGLFCACFTIEAPGQRTLRVLFARLHSAGKAFLDAHGAAFVTGTSSGIDAGVVLAALEAGDRVVATARNLEELRSAIGRPANDRLAFLPLDVTSEAQAQRSIAAAVDWFGRIDVQGTAHSTAVGCRRRGTVSMLRLNAVSTWSRCD